MGLERMADGLDGRVRVVVFVYMKEVRLWRGIKRKRSRDRLKVFRDDLLDRGTSLFYCNVQSASVQSRYQIIAQKRSLKKQLAHCAKHIKRLIIRFSFVQMAYNNTACRISLFHIPQAVFCTGTEWLITSPHGSSEGKNDC